MLTQCTVILASRMGPVSIFADVGIAMIRRAYLSPNSRYFDSVKILLFLAPISAFDQYLEEDPRVNRIKDSLELWKSLTVSRAH
jgi:guanine nucleotide-binding protein subunit alpha